MLEDVVTVEVVDDGDGDLAKGAAKEMYLSCDKA